MEETVLSRELESLRISGDKDVAELMRKRKAKRKAERKENRELWGDDDGPSDPHGLMNSERAYVCTIMISLSSFYGS